MSKNTFTVIDDQRRSIGFFMDPGDADSWISTRVNPKMFKVLPNNKERLTAAPGIYLAKGDKRLPNADENGLLLNPPWPKVKAKKAAPKPSSKTDEELIDAAIIEEAAS